MEEKKPSLSNSTIGLMAGVAIFFDTLKALLDFIFMGWLVTPVAYGTFWLWFKMRGLSFFSLKRAPTIGIGFLIEMIPGINVLPAITYTVVRIALDTKFKENVSDNILDRAVGRHSKRIPRENDSEGTA